MLVSSANRIKSTSFDTLAISLIYNERIRDQVSNPEVLHSLYFLKQRNNHWTEQIEVYWKSNFLPTRKPNHEFRNVLAYQKECCGLLCRRLSINLEKSQPQFLFDQSQLKSYHTNLLKQEKSNDFSENRTDYQIIYYIYQSIPKTVIDNSFYEFGETRKYRDWSVAWKHLDLQLWKEELPEQFSSHRVQCHELWTD